MIRVTHSYNSVMPDIKLRHRWAILSVNAYAAEALGDMESYNKLCKMVNDEYNQWKSNAEYECKKKSHKDWLGGGDTYSVNYRNPLEENESYRMIFSNTPPQTIHQFLAQESRNKWMSLYPAY